MEQVNDSANGFSRRRPSQLAGAAAAVPMLHRITAAGTASAAGDQAAIGPPTGERRRPDAVARLPGDANQQAAWDALFQAFNEAHPEIKLEANGIPAGSWGNYVTTVATQLAGGQKYDIVYVATEGQRLFATKNLLLPLDDYIAADQDVIDDYFADVNPNLKEWTAKYGSPDGKTYYIPGGYNTMVLYANTKVFEDAGVELPESDWTWDEFHEAGVKIKESSRAFLASDGLGLPVRPDHAVAAHQRGEHDGRGVDDGHVQLPRRRGSGRVREAVHRRRPVAGPRR